MPNQPSIIFIDEIDSLVSARSDNETEASRRVKTEFMVQMQGVGSAKDGSILVLGATNLPWALDGAMRRRFEKRIMIPLPDVEARLALLKNRMKNETHTLTDADFLSLAQRSDFYSGSDLSALIKNACYEPLRRFQGATHFRQGTINGKSGWIACAPHEPGATPMSAGQLKSDQILKGQVDMEAFEKALLNTKPTVGPNELVKFDEWTKQFGMDG